MTYISTLEMSILVSNEHNKVILSHDRTPAADIHRPLPRCRLAINQPAIAAAAAAASGVGEEVTADRHQMSVSVSDVSADSNTGRSQHPSVFWPPSF